MDELLPGVFQRIAQFKHLVPGIVPHDEHLLFAFFFCFKLVVYRGCGRVAVDPQYFFTEYFFYVDVNFADVVTSDPLPEGRSDVAPVFINVGPRNFAYPEDVAFVADPYEYGSAAVIQEGAALYGTDATLDTFKHNAPRYRILHLSTHGQADVRLGDNAFLAFSTSNANNSYDKLYARHVYNLYMNADLVVLSACETGIGKMERGEGMVSLARAFAYAGAKSIVTTLWKVNDEKTQDLIPCFYSYLLAEKTKSEALRSVKLDFLEANRGNGGATLHPFFWSGLIGIGDMGALKL